MIDESISKEVMDIAQKESMDLQVVILYVCEEHIKKSKLDPVNAELMASRGVNAACRAIVECMDRRIGDIVEKVNKRIIEAPLEER